MRLISLPKSQSKAISYKIISVSIKSLFTSNCDWTDQSSQSLSGQNYVPIDRCT